MPVEYILLKDKPWPEINCPCGEVCCKALKEEPLMRGQVHSGWRKLLGLSYCAVICPAFGEVVGWEKPDKKELKEALKSRKRPF